MKAFVLAGGLGTRLRPRFGELPKPLAPLGGRPFLERQLEWLKGHGVREVVVCSGHGATAVREALGDGAALGMSIAYSVEPTPLGTGGALRLALSHVDGPCCVVNGDTLPEADPWALERLRWESSALGAVAVFEVDDGRTRGSVDCDGEGRVLRFVEKDPAGAGKAWVNGGLYAFSPRVWRQLPEGVSSLERDLLPALAAEGRLVAARLEGTFYDIGTPDEWERAERRFAS